MDQKKLRIWTLFTQCSADLKLSLCACTLIKIIPSKFRILNSKNSRVYDMFIYKFTKIIEQVKKSPSFFKKYKLYKYIA